MDHPSVRDPGDEVGLPTDVALELARAFVATQCARSGVRMLMVKGSVTEHYGLRRPRPSADVDVLLAPADAPAVSSMLKRLGWVPRPMDPQVREFPVHAHSFYHPRWPVDIDVHFAFPGIEADPAQAFDHLWGRRGSLVEATIEVPVVDRAAALIVQALTVLRAPFHGSYEVELDHLVDVAPTQVGGAEVVALADQLGATAALRPFLERAFPGDCPTHFPAVSRTWELYTTHSESASIRIAALRNARRRDIPGQLFRAVWPSQAALAAVDLSALSADAAQLRRLRIKRLARFARRTPVVLGEVRAFRRSERRHG